MSSQQSPHSSPPSSLRQSPHSSYRRRHLVSLVLGVTVVTCTLTWLAATPATPTTRMTPTSSRAQLPATVHELTKADLDAWLDGAVPALLEEGQIPGATVAVVKNRALLSARGYGAADRGNRHAPGATAVDPDRHLFRIGSTSKLFTAVAAMQLVEQHKLDLDTDVQHYLDFPLPAPKGRVTARQLLPHHRIRRVPGARFHHR